MENLNAEQIKKVLDHCANWTAETGCKGCPYDENCIDKDVIKDALALITSQDQRIKELAEENERLRGFNLAKCEDCAGCTQWNCDCANIEAQAKYDTVRKMQEALEQRIHSKLSYHGWYLKETVIAEIAKEMLEEVK